MEPPSGVYLDVYKRQHGDQYSHILRRHIGGVGELDVQVTAEAHVFVDADVYKRQP